MIAAAETWPIDSSPRENGAVTITGARCQTPSDTGPLSSVGGPGNPQWKCHPRPSFEQVPVAWWQVCRCLISHRSSVAWASVPCEWNQGIGPCQAANTTQTRSPTAHQRALKATKRRWVRRKAIIGVEGGRFSSRHLARTTPSSGGGRHVAGAAVRRQLKLAISSNHRRQHICLSLGSLEKAVKERLTGCRPAVPRPTR